MKKVATLLITITFILSGSVSLQAQQQTVGLFLNDSASFSGYTLYGTFDYPTIFLIDNEGSVVHFWNTDLGPGTSYLLEDGKLLRIVRVPNPNFPSGASGGRVQIMEWDGTLVWDYAYSSEEYLQHHDIEMLPNGNVLMIAWENKTAEDAIQAGRNPDLLKGGKLLMDYVVEVEPTGYSSGNIVWEWHTFDHLIQDYDSTKDNYGVVWEHPELIDINIVPEGKVKTFTHFNAIDYNEALDQILIGEDGFREVWVIDHSTTTEETSGHTGGNSGKGGDLLYRWGNPQTYRAGNEDDQKLFRLHNAQWIDPGNPGEGNILAFNNGTGRPDGNYSSIDEIVPPVDENGNYELIPGSAYGPEEPVWSYTAENPTDFYASFISGAQRLPNGNTLICDGPKGIFFEVTPDKEIVWKYVNPVTLNGILTQGECIQVAGDARINRVFRILRYAPDYPGLAGRDLTPGESIELYPALLRGDLNEDTEINIADIEYLINYLFREGLSPNTPAAGDANGSFTLNISDVVYLINYVLQGGPPPSCP
jgi:hypothetical protein